MKIKRFNEYIKEEFKIIPGIDELEDLLMKNLPISETKRRLAQLIEDYPELEETDEYRELASTWKFNSTIDKTNPFN